MKWKRIQRKETRIIEKFAWLPVCNARETRWLERVTVKQYAVRGVHGYYWGEQELVDAQTVQEAL